MNVDVLVKILAEAGKKAGKDNYEFTGDAALMLDIGSSLTTIEKVRQVEVKDGLFVRVSSARGESYLVGIESVIGVRLGRAAAEGTGFVAG